VTRLFVIFSIRTCLILSISLSSPFARRMASTGSWHSEEHTPGAKRRPRLYVPGQNIIYKRQVAGGHQPGSIPMCKRLYPGTFTHTRKYTAFFHFAVDGWVNEKQTITTVQWKSILYLLNDLKSSNHNRGRSAHIKVVNSELQLTFMRGGEG